MATDMGNQGLLEDDFTNVATYDDEDEKVERRPRFDTPVLGENPLLPNCQT